jgi:hypothetical protein
MRSVDRANLILGLLVLLVALFVACVWVPLDTASGMIEKVRRQVTIGDALAPTVACGFLVIGGLMVAFLERPEAAHRLTLRNLLFLFYFLAILGLGLAVMRWFGPVLAGVLMEGGYRPLRDTAPWKHLGFLFGGAGMIAAMISMVEGRVTLRAVLVGLAAAIGLIIIYDLPFDDLLLPPNGDV